MANSDQETVTNQGEQKQPYPDIEVTLRDDQELIGGLDPSTLDPNLHYRFVHDSPQKVARRLSRGYRFVRPSSDGVAKLYDTGGNDGEDVVRHADTVLMCIPKDIHKQQEDKVAAITRARLAAPKGQFRKKARGHGVNVNDKKE